MTDASELEALRRENRILRHKLRRSELNRARLEQIRDSSNRVLRKVIEDMDATQRELLESERRAQEANRAKSAFLANMSHELRTPLNAVIAYAEVLLEEGDNLRDTQLEDLQVVLDAGHHLLRLISSVLDLSKIEADRLELSWEDVAIDDVVREVVATARPVVEEAGNRFEITCCTDGLVLSLDRLRLAQVLLNLLSNAGKFCRGGVVTLTVGMGRDHLAFAVEDTGIGMSADELARVFDPFVQADASTSRLYGGTGLGLAVARDLVELMGGRIEVMSRPGEGSTFTVLLPLDAPRAPAVERASVGATLGIQRATWRRLSGTFEVPPVSPKSRH